MITNDWNKYLDAFSPMYRDLYFTLQYHQLYTSADRRPSAFIYEESDKKMLFPFLSKEAPIFDGSMVKDFESAYGYGGPIFNCQDNAFASRSLRAFYEQMREAGYLAGFVRFHPLLGNYSEFESIGTLILNRKTIAIDLTAPIEEVWMTEIHTKNRNVIKKGAKEGLSFVADYDYADLRCFIALYNKTMDKLHADGFYYFPEDYFTEFPRLFPNSFIGKVIYDNRVIAAAIFFYDGIYGHYHLAGSDAEYLRLSPNNFLLWGAAQELKKNGVRYMHLGGGTDADENNSLFQFKRKFSKTTHDFYIGKVIFDNERYRSIVTKWAEAFPQKEQHYSARLLKYRY